MFSLTRQNAFLLTALLTTLFVSACSTIRPEATAATPSVAPPNEQSLHPSPAEATTSTESLEDIEFENFEQLYLKDEANHSIWPRIRAGFQLPDQVTDRSLQAELDWYAGHEAYLYRVIDRADPFLFYILEEAEKRNLPTELVLLPIVESAYQPFAYSHGRAAGIWQFIPATGKLYGLKQNWWYDGRRDIYASTRAALNYLENLNKMFKGDWLLALAAYNSGSGTVQRAVRRNKKRGKPTDFWHLKLPKETRAYVPKLLALKELIRHPEKYGISLRCIPDAPGFRQVKTRTQIDLALAAKLAEIDLETLYNYNPGYNRWATAPDGPYTLLLPVEAADIFEKNYAALPEDQHIKWTRHKIRSGETLSEIASQYNTTVRHLKKVNNIHGNTIRAGKHLLIPVASRNIASYKLSSTQRLKSIQNRRHGNGSTRVTHIVQKGESFWDISRKYGVDMHKLAKWNGMAIRDPLKQGQKLVVWTRHGNRSARTHNPNSTIKSIHYTVRNGDSLARIASRYNVRVKDLHRWNTLKGKYIQPGQRLKLYIDVTEQSGSSG